MAATKFKDYAAKVMEIRQPDLSADTYRNY